MNSVRFNIASQVDNSELIQFSRESEMPGELQFIFDRAPDYFHALRVEGKHSEVMICRGGPANALVGTGHRSIKPAFLNGQSAAMGYLSGLRLHKSFRNGLVMARGYKCLRELHSKGPAKVYLTTVMENNTLAKRVLASGRLGLPNYHDLGRFCCMALSLRTHWSSADDQNVRVRHASAADGAAVIAFLRDYGRLKQFFPEYTVEDFGEGLLPHLEWKDVFLAFRGDALLGVVAAWDQRVSRRWQITAYGPRMAYLRPLLNIFAKLRGMPQLPRTNSLLSYFILSLVCIQKNDANVFNSLMEAVIREKRNAYDFFLAGFHERDPLLSCLQKQPHLPLPSRLYAVAWEDGAETVRNLDPALVPYLELGSL